MPKIKNFKKMGTGIFKFSNIKVSLNLNQVEILKIKTALIFFLKTRKS